MKEYYILILPSNPDHATRELTYWAGKGWRVVGVLYYGGMSNSVILERDKVAA